MYLILSAIWSFFGNALQSLPAASRSFLPQSLNTLSTQEDSTKNRNQEDKPQKKTSWYEVGGQVTILPQTMFPFHSPYAGLNSMPSYVGTRTTESATLYLGARITPNLEAYIDPEWLRGAGLGAATGIAGFPNVEIVRIGVQPIPYIGRAFLRATVPTGKRTVDLEPDENQIPGKSPADALVFTFGKVAASDLFDKNAYANSGRTQFMNWSLVNNEAYDYDADVRGYTFGGALEWKHPRWAVRLGEFQMPTRANGPELATNLGKDHGDQIELEWHPTSQSNLRLLAYRNVAHMGSYQDSLNLSAATHEAPVITAVERDGEVKYGYGLSYDLGLGDGGDTGLFARAGWNNGATETFAYTESDASISGGVQVSGKRWHCPKDRAAIALVISGLSSEHEAYLAAGGYGFQVGDGRLSYGNERILETYYARQWNKLFQGTIDFQFIQNPGYNQDRGPIPVLSARLHFEF